MPEDLNKRRKAVFGEPLLVVDSSGRPVLKKRSGPAPAKGQRRFKLATEPIAATASESTLQEPTRLKPWQELVLNKGTRDEIRMQGRYYTIASDRRQALEVWDSPPETRGAVLLDRIRGYNVFVIKDSELASDPLRRGWAEIIVLEITPPGERQKIKRFFDGTKDVTICRARFNDIKAKGNR
jgi:hypothetical protein